MANFSRTGSQVLTRGFFTVKLLVCLRDTWISHIFITDLLSVKDTCINSDIILFSDIILTAARLAQLGERRSAEREVASSNPGRTNTQGLKNN